MALAYHFTTQAISSGEKLIPNHNYSEQEIIFWQ